MQFDRFEFRRALEVVVKLRLDLLTLDVQLAQCVNVADSELLRRLTFILQHEDFPAAFKQAQASGKPAIVRLKIDPEALTPGMTLSKIREKSLADKAN